MSEVQAGIHYSAFLREPEITWRHIDGPLMCWAGRMHWLTLWERICLRLGLKTPRSIAEERFNGARAQYEWAIILHNRDNALRSGSSGQKLADAHSNPNPNRSE